MREHNWKNLGCGIGEENKIITKMASNFKLCKKWKHQILYVFHTAWEVSKYGKYRVFSGPTTGS